MPLTDTQADAVSRVYAQAAFETADAAGGQSAIEEVAGELEDIVELARSDDRFSEFVSSRILGVADRRDSIKKIFEGRVTSTTLNLLLVLNDKERLGKLAAVAAAFDALLQERFGRVEVDVTTAAPADPALLESVKEKLRAALGKEPVIHAYTDESLIGGLRVRVGDQLIDGSVATRLRRLRESFATNGAPQLRARVEQLFGE